MLLLAAAMPAAFGATCTTQAALSPADRNALIGAGVHITTAVAQQDYASLQSQLLPSISSQWEGIRNEVEQGAPLLKGGQPQLENIYLLDASTQTATADTQFFCSNQSGTLTVTITLPTLPPGKYALLLATTSGATLGGQIGAIVVWDTTGAVPAWKLGGLSVRQGVVGGHDGVWYWSHARAQAASGATWSAFYSYELARYLLLPVNYLSSPNMEKLLREQSELRGQPGPFPLMLQDGTRTWKIEGIRVDTVLREADLNVTYESLGIGDAAAARTEATAVMSAVLKAHPELREGFHGVWASAEQNGKVTPVIELPMAQIP
jgi:hypothetical protein